jgi:primosomal protein N' (replication factor Y) (superfamily II helicase)
MYAELVINVEAHLENTFHYHVPRDLQAELQVGHLVEVEFGRRLAQGVVAGLHDAAPVAETKPIIAIIDPLPVLYPWQIELARWLSESYLAPLNGCIRLLLPPGLTRWADVTAQLNPRWDGSGRLTELQEQIVAMLRERGDLRGRQIRRALPKKVRSHWQEAVNQLARREIIIKGTALDPPRIRPKHIRTATLSAGPRQIWAVAPGLGRASKQSDVLHYLVHSDDPLPAETAVREATGGLAEHVDALVEAGLIQRVPDTTLLVAAVPAERAPDELRELLAALPLAVESIAPGGLAQLEEAGLATRQEQPAALNLAISLQQALQDYFRLRGSEKVGEILALLAAEAQPVPVGDIYAATGSSIQHLRRLAAADLIRLGDEQVWRDPLAGRDFVPSEAPSLTRDQAEVWRILRQSMDALAAGEAQPRPFLLHGVTGSGKTEIYMHAIERALDRGQQAIVLVPEIALTPQTVRRFAARFPGRVAVLHSRLSDGERYDTWRRARRGLFDIVVGPRSALFTPLPNIGVIVLDEEHDHSYKQTPPVPPPYYHARETAVEMGRLLRATVILGSATPDMVSYHRARAGDYQLVELSRRVLGHRKRIEQQVVQLNLPSRYEHEAADPDEAMTIPLPPVQVVDMRQELRAGNRSVFSRPLQSALDEVLARREQAILFLNRRGTSSFILCRDCGLVLRCPRCDVPLTYHRPDMALACHHCGRRVPVPTVCPNASRPVSSISAWAPRTSRVTCSNAGPRRARYAGTVTRPPGATRTNSCWPASLTRKPTCSSARR